MLLKLKTKATPCRAKFFFWEHFKCAEVNSTLSKRNGNLSKLEWNLAICSSKLPTCLRKLPIQNWPQHYKVARKRASCLTGILLHKRPLQCPLLVPCNFGTWAPLWQVFSTQGHPLIHLVSHNFGIWVSPLEQAWVIYSYMAIPGTTWSVFPWEGGGGVAPGSPIPLSYFPVSPKFCQLLACVCHWCNNKFLKMKEQWSPILWPPL